MRADEVAVQQATQGLAGAGRRPFRRLWRDRAAMAGLAIIAVFVLAAVFAPALSPHAPNATDFSNLYASPSADHPLGTDELGRDVLSRLIHGGRLSIAMAVSATAGITLVGLVLGLVAGLARPRVETLIMRAVDVLLALPTLILALVVVGLLGQGLRNLIVAIILVQWPRYARLVRGMTLEIRERDFVQAALAAGARKTRIMFRHVAPNLIGPVVVFSTIDMGSTLLAISGLSFLGLGIPPPTAEWGAMMSEAREVFNRAPQLLLYPGAAITLMALAFNLAGDGLRDLLDPRSATAGDLWRRRVPRRLRKRAEKAPAPVPAGAEVGVADPVKLRT